MKTNKRQVLLTSSVALLMVTAAVFAGPPTVGDVGDTDSFGKNMHFLGDASGFINLSTTPCPASTPATSPAPSPANSNQCFTIDPTPGNPTTIDAPNIDRINLPAGAAKDVIYPVLTFFTSYQMQNPTAAQVQTAKFFYSATLTIYSPVLNDPSIIDPNANNGNGAPANGALTFVFSPNRFDVDRSLEGNERVRNRLDYSRAANAGIAKAALISAGTLTQHQADDLFNKPMTVRMDVTGLTRYVTDASITCNMRLFGD